MPFSIYCAIRCEHGLGVLDLANGGGRDPAVINMGDVSMGNSNQQWQVESYQDSNTRVVVRHPASGRLLFSRGAAQNLGCEFLGDGDVRTHWILEPDSGSVDLRNYRGERFRFRNEADGFYIDLWEAKNVSGNPYKCGGKSGNNQNFKLVSYWK